MLAIPKKRIYNAVSLRSADAPLIRRMVEKAKEALMKDIAQQYYIGHKDFDLSADVLDPRQLEFFVHCHPKHSVGHLHVHCCLKNLWTTNGNLLASKNMPVRYILNEIDPALTATSEDASPMTQRAISKMKQAHELLVSQSKAAKRRSSLELGRRSSMKDVISSASTDADANRDRVRQPSLEHLGLRRLSDAMRQRHAQ
jgi:hypothetical protein